MSGFLGKCTIPKYGSVLAYENTSTNPASVTIGSQIPSTTENSCLSIKIDDTTNTIQTCETIHNDILPNDELIGYFFDPDDSCRISSFKGQLKYCNYTPGYSFYDNSGTVTDNYISEFRQPESQCRCLNIETPFPSNGWPTCFRQWESCCCYTIKACEYAESIQMNRFSYHPRSFTAQSSVDHFENVTTANGYFVMPSWKDDPACDQIGGLAIVCSNSFLNLSNKDRFTCYYSGICYACPDVADQYGTSSCAAYIGGEYWSDAPIIAKFSYDYGCACELEFKFYDRSNGVICTRRFTKSSDDCVVRAISGERVFENNAWCCGSCRTAFCGTARLGYPSYRPIQSVCNALILQDVDTSGSSVHIIGTKVPCYGSPGECNGIYSTSCYLGSWSTLTDSGSALRPCITGGFVNWATYDPYNDRNVLMVSNSALSNDENAAGYYEYDPDRVCWWNYCNCGDFNTSWSSSDISVAGITKLADFSGDPSLSLWENNCCMQNQLRIQPYQVSDECWVSWVQCFVPYFCSNSDNIDCWNGCMIKYVSHNLICWCEATDEQSSYYIVQANGNRELIYVSNSGELEHNTDFFFNTACIGNEGLIEYYTSANQYERTGLVIGPGDKVWIADDSGLENVPVQIWGYDE